MNAFGNTFIYKFSEWVMRLSLLNLLWIFFTVIGAGFVGFFPATVAMFSMVRHWIKGNADEQIFKTFLDLFKRHLLKANILGYISAIGGVILYLDYMLVKNSSGPFQMVMLLLLIPVSFYYLMVTFFVFPVYVHYDIRLMECFKYAFIIGASYPVRTIYMAFVTFVVYYVTVSFSILFLFFSGSVLSLLIMRFTYVAFEKVEVKNNRMAEPA
ncbi:YesL family protein [Gracilibacillus orientalis]|uniref:YesL family protein n=1 Tax=Gracilibacillus orientalis TaxID=334253 RepID=UPI001C31DBF3|nr:YesL family protein [Gracilibacillus orientalis]